MKEVYLCEDEVQKARPHLYQDPTPQSKRNYGKLKIRAVAERSIIDSGHNYASISHFRSPSSPLVVSSILYLLAPFYI